MREIFFAVLTLLVHFAMTNLSDLNISPGTMTEPTSVFDSCTLVVMGNLMNELLEDADASTGGELSKRLFI